MERAGLVKPGLILTEPSRIPGVSETHRRSALGPHRFRRHSGRDHHLASAMSDDAQNTERPITIEQGTNRLVGTDPQRIIQAAH